MSDAADLLRVEELTTRFPVAGGVVRAVEKVSFRQRPGETLGIVGESGCGKSTLARSILQLVRPSSGRVLFEGTDLVGLPARRLRALRRHLQIVFQDPMASLDPRFTVGRILEEPLVIHGFGPKAARRERVAAMLGKVGLDAAAATRYPHEFSGGQRQRIGIARAIMLEPKLVVLDEPVSALDVSIQAQILNLLADLRESLGLSYLFISHDLAVVRAICDRVAVMYLGRILEEAPTGQLFEQPAHPYTEALLSAVPQPEPGARRRRIVVTGEPPDPARPPAGCPFHPRCPRAIPVCRRELPPLRRLDGRRRVACHLHHASSDASGINL